ncbi:uncharacterized protein LOC119190566 [Manduca sexta]|uniref:uncharacterized protein LOC119190566 n=1 Tax=Manduca sexta TaxID=7130 RepID=UPI00188DD8F2|nr:uncharacterized protein LOC119190566 [Manduca sexta]
MPFPCKRVATRRGQGQAADKEEPQPTTSDSEQEITFVGPSAQASTPTPTAPVPAATSPITDHMFKIMELFARSQAEANQKLLETIMANTTSASPEAGGVIKMKSAGNFSKCSARFDGTTGDAETLEAFIDAVLVFKECAGVTDENAVRGLPMLLTGNAAVWWQGIKKDVHDWEDAIARLRGMYGIVKPAYKLFREIFAYEHTLPERSEVFACKIRALISQLPYDLCDAARIDIVYGLLDLNFCDRLRLVPECERIAPDSLSAVSTDIVDVRYSAPQNNTDHDQCHAVDREIPTTFIVIPGADARTLLGCDFIKRAGIAINLLEGKWSFTSTPDRVYDFVRSYSVKSAGGADLLCTDASPLSLRPDEGAHLSEEQRAQMNEMIARYASRFAVEGEPTGFITHRIKTDEKQEPIASQPYRMSPAKVAILEKELDKLQRADVIEECGVPVGSQHRPEPDRYPLPRMDDVLHAAKTTNFMTTLDLQSGYFQVSVAEEDRDKTAFITPIGTFRFKRMPMGLRNSGATFQRLMDRFKSNLPGTTLLCYLDDLIVLSDSFTKHLEDLQAVFDRLELFNLRVNRTKSVFARDSVKFLGHLIVPGGIQVDPEKTAAINDMAKPTNLKHLKCFLQTSSWFRRFIPNYAEIARPLTALLKKGECLALAERNYTTTEREALAVVWAVGKFRGYIEGAQIIVKSDHQPLKWLMSIKSPSGRLTRWALTLQEFDLRIEYTPRLAAPRSRRQKIMEDLEATDEPFRGRPWADRGYIMSDGVLYRYNPEPSDDDDACLVVPIGQRPKILFEYHDAPTAGHLGVERTLQRIASRYYWPGMRASVTDYVKQCTSCQRYKVDARKPAGLVQSPAAAQRFEVVAVDLFGPLPVTKSGNRWILIAEDVCSRLISDNGVQFISEVMQQVCFAFGIDQALTPYYHPEANPVEHVVHDMRTVLDGDRFVANFTPYLKRLTTVLIDARDAHEKAQAIQKRYADEKRRPAPDYKVGDLVLLKTHGSNDTVRGQTPKFIPRRDGPYVIKEVLSSTTYRLENGDGDTLGKYHVSQLTPFVGQSESPVAVDDRRAHD